MNRPITLTELAAAWRAAKDAETAATLRRRDIEEQMLALLPSPESQEGSVTLDGVSATYKLTRKVDTESLQAAWHQLPEHARRCFRWKAEVDTKQMRAVAELDPSAYKTAAEFITATPSKPTISIKE